MSRRLPLLIVSAAVATITGQTALALPKAEVPQGLEFVIAAAPPLVNHPMMGTVDDRGRLFVGDAAGLNLNRQGLEEQLPNQVVMLEDSNGDGVYDKSTVFADKMTFPQGGAWLNGSLYVASPPGIWKLTDTNGDGVADQREMIVGGYSFDGNAADVHGPFLHPNGRLYWCHGRKGHNVVQKDGTVVHEGLASGIWSCQPDGSDVQWHSLGCMDNPVEVDFTPEGDIFGVVNLYYNQPRGDTLVHWLYGGVYERPDQLRAIVGLPRTQEHMPIVHNFGHVAVSGSTFYRSGALNPAWKGDMFVTFFNTQKVVRTKLVPAGATFTATQHEFLKINDPDVHVTDVLEDGDGSMLVIDTGGWFRIGCPASMTAKPDFKGAIYRVQKKNAPRVADAFGLKVQWDKLTPADVSRFANDDRWMVRRRAVALGNANRRSEEPALADLRATAQPIVRLRACEAIARAKRIDPAQREALLAMLGETLDPALEHAAIYAALTTRCFGLETLRQAVAPVVIRRLMVVVDQSATDAAERDALVDVARKQVDAADADLARTAVAVVVRHPRALELLQQDFATQLTGPSVTRGILAILTEVTSAQLAKPEAQALVTAMLKHTAPGVRQAAWRVISLQSGGNAGAGRGSAPGRGTGRGGGRGAGRGAGGDSGGVTHPDWFAPLDQSLGSASASDLPLLLEAIGKLRTDHFDAALRALINDEGRPQPIRLKSLAAASRPNQPLGAAAFAMLTRMANGGASPTARVDAVRFLARSRLSKEQLSALSPVLQTAGPVELRTLLPLTRQAFDAELGRTWAESLARSPFVGSVEESLIRTNFASLPAEQYEKILGPVVRGAAEAQDAKKRRLEALSAGAAKGRVSEGRKAYENSACVACHKAGGLGRAMGPDLSRIGQIRSERDLLESILFPDATIARDYETHVVETADGQTYTGMVKNNSVDGLVLMDLAGQEKTLPQTQIVANTVMPTSLMPMGLEQSLSEQQLLDLVAWLASLK